MIGLIESLQENDKSKKNLFVPSTMSMGYPTRLAPMLDYMLGYNVHVYEGNNYIETYPSLGIKDGSAVMIIGKSSTAKTTMAIQIASNIVRNYQEGVVIHYDIERSMNYTRIATLSRFTMPQIASGKYILRRECTTIQDIKRSLAAIYLEKTNNPEKYIVKENIKNEFNRTTEIFAPTVCIIDSIASLLSDINENTKDGKERLEDVASQTDQMRRAAEIGRFYNEILPMLSAANIIIIVINHIHARGSMGIPQAAELQYLGQDEALPGGKTPPYLSNTLFKASTVNSMKYNKADDGFDGTGIRLRIVKSRGNVNGKEIDLVLNLAKGIDYLRSTLEYANTLGFVGGDRRGKYFLDHKEVKWKPATVYEDFKEHPELSNILFEIIQPSLNNYLQEQAPVNTEEADEELALQYRY